MRFSIALTALAASVASASYGYGNTTAYTTTEVVTSFTTFCPGPTQITHGTQVYTVTSATTLTITNCPCTLTKTYSSVPPPATPPAVAPTVTTPAPPVTPVPTGTAPVGTGSSSSVVYGNSTVPNVVPPSTPSTAAPSFETGSANRATVAGGALAGVLGMVAYLL